MSDLSTAIIVATEAHAGQLDKGGEPYILHPLRVMLSLTNPTERIVAVLHDVVEDSDLTLDDLRAYGFSATVIEAVDALTRSSGEPYDAFILRAKANNLARAVKIADLRDNTRIERIAHPTDADWKRMEKYGRALSELYT